MDKPSTSPRGRVTMPSEASLKAANPKANPKGKGKIPTWGWIAAGVIGIIIGYVLLKNSGASASAAGAETPASPGVTPSTDKTNPPGDIAIPWDQILRALGVMSGATQQATTPASVTESSGAQQ